MDPLWDIYMKVEALSSDVACSGLRTAGPYKEKTGRNGAILSQESTGSGIPRQRTCLIPCWATSEVLPRALGILAFFLPILGTTIQFVLTIFYPALFAGGDSGVHVPGHFAIGDTLAKSPTRYTGIGFATISIGLLLAVGYYRHRQIFALSCPLFPAVLKKALVSEVLGVSFAVFTMMASTIMPSNKDLSIQSKGHLAFWIAAIFTVSVYGYIQIVLIEGALVQQQLLYASSQKIRTRLMFISGICLITFFPLLIIRDFPQGMSSKDNPIDENASPMLGIAILLFQIGSMTLTLAVFGLTDFASMPYNTGRLQELRAIWKKSREPIKVMIGSKSGKSKIMVDC